MSIEARIGLREVFWDEGGVFFSAPEVSQSRRVLGQEASSARRSMRIGAQYSAPRPPERVGVGHVGGAAESARVELDGNEKMQDSYR